MPILELPTFQHDDKAVYNYIDCLLKNDDLENRSQLILIAGIALNNIKLMKYATSIDPTVVNRIVPNYILEATDAALSSVTGKQFSNVADTTAPQ